jgi:hypothetical protein
MQFRLQTWRRISLQKSNTISDGAHASLGPPLAFSRRYLLGNYVAEQGVAPRVGQSQHTPYVVFSGRTLTNARAAANPSIGQMRRFYDPV